MGILIPLYIDPGYAPEPGGMTDWEYLVRMKHQFPQVKVTAIINPNSGPGNEQQQSYVEGIDLLHREGIKVAGYLPVGYFKKTMDTVYSMLGQWLAWYPGIDSIFLDEFPSSYSPKEDDLCSRIAESCQPGKQLIINPGMYFEISRNILSVPFSSIVSWENRSYPKVIETVKQLDASSHIHKHLEHAVLVLEQKLRSRLVKKQLLPFYDWVFITPYAVDENPWGKMDRKMLKKLFITCS